PAIPPSRLNRLGERRIWIIVGVALLIILAAVFLLPRRTSGRARAGVDGGSKRPMLLVLPFGNLGAPEDEYLADGLREKNPGKLANVSGLGVIPRTSAMQYKKTVKPIQQIGQELGVQDLVTGNVRYEKQADGRSRVRISSELIRIKDATQVWS